jgi:hypothetical protein
MKSDNIGEIWDSPELHLQIIERIQH